MKKCLLSIVSIIAFSTITFAQKLKSSPTTETEYNFATKGYRVQVESGLDMKQGYALGDIDVIKVGDYTFDVKALVRSGKNEIAALMVITKSTIWGNAYYFCIPHGNNSLSQKYYNDLALWDESITTAYAYLMSSKLGELSAEAYEMEKTLRE